MPQGSYVWVKLAGGLRWRRALQGGAYCGRLSSEHVEVLDVPVEEDECFLLFWQEALAHIIDAHGRCYEVKRVLVKVTTSKVAMADLEAAIRRKADWIRKCDSQVFTNSIDIKT